jgi:CubicO group peptidase (beta-lactamase class C family)
VTFTADTLHDIRSVSKSVVSMLFGIARGDGAVPNLDTPVLEYFPELADLRTPERLQITVRNALTMTTGLHWDERTYPYTDRRNSEIAMEFAPDIYRHTLTQTIDTPPGTHFNYSGGDVALIGAIVARETKMPLETFARQRLFGPLGIAQFEWSKRGDIPRAQSGLRLTTPDLAKLGQLMLNGGRWNGVQIVPQDWVIESTSPHIAVEPDPECGTKYGYFWWLEAGCETQPHTPGFVGVGNGGQRLWVVPSRKLVVALTAGLYDDPRQRDMPTAVLAGVLAAVR